MPTDKATELIHLTYDGNFQLETDATVLLCRVISDETNGNTEIKASNEVGDARTVPIELQLDITTMHPQGGGQPTDIGTIVRLLENSNSDDTPHSAVIDKVTIDRATGIVTHAGSITLNKNDPSLPPSGFFPEHSKVRVSVNQANRRLLSECHTAGHVVDAAMAKCDKLLPPTKGYHFMDGPYVEYKGSIDVKEREDFLQMLKVAYQELINEDIPTQIQTLPANKAESLCNRLAQNFNISDFTSPTDADPQVRVVTVAKWYCPCGGTHVRSTGDLKERGWCVKGLRCKKGVVRVRYGPKEDEVKTHFCSVTYEREQRLETYPYEGRTCNNKSLL